VKERLQRLAIPAAIFVVTAIVYAITLGPRREGPSENNHYVHLAESWLSGELGVIGNRPPGYNDWACYDTEMHGICRHDAQTRARESQRWYVSFPPFPAAVIAPMVAIFGRDFSDPLFWAFFAGFAPALLYVLLRRMREEKTTERTPREDLLLVAMFAFGSVYFSTAVQGSVWFAAHVVASALLVLFFLFALGAKRPFWAGLMLALCFACRPSVWPFGFFFVLEALRVSREGDVWYRDIQWPALLKRGALFVAPIAAVIGGLMWMNFARFEDPFEFGHEYLMIRWRPRIEKWGLANYHYLSKNLSVFLASLPWLSGVSPYVKISRHGLALWITSPNLYPAIWPKKVDMTMVALYVSTALVALIDLCYQNSGWVQFGYRFSLDYMPALVMLVAMSRRKLGVFFIVLLAIAIAINTFGAITFDRAHVFYDDDMTQDRLFQPD
jgi:hypothetical protein